MIYKNTPAYLPYIDGLRAFAVLAVIAYHLQHNWLPGGFAGVDVFFVISGFVVSASMDKHGSGNLGSFALRFYSRRMRRILPALVVCLLFFSLISALFIPSCWLSDTNDKTGLYAFFGLSNVVLIQTNNSYFSPRVDFNPYTHTWSLGVEEQFYFIFPLLFFLWVLRKKNAQRLSVSIFIFLALLSLICAWWFAYRDGAFAYYTIFTRFWELASGVLLYQFTVHFTKGQAVSGSLINKIGTVICIGLLILGFILSNPQQFPFPWALLPVFGTLGLLFFLRHDEKNFLHIILGNRYVTLIGRLSYSLYLWHWPVIVLFRWTVGIESAYEYVAILIITFMLAAASYNFIEFPCRHARIMRGLPNLATVLAGITLVVISYLVADTINRHQAQLSLSVTTQRTLWYPGEAQWESKETACPVQHEYLFIQGNLLQRLFPNCAGDNPHYQRKQRLFAVGDSHTDAYFSMLKRLSAETGMEILIYAKGGCPYIGLFNPHGAATSNCQQFYQAVLDDIQQRSQAGDILFLSSLRMMRLGDQWASFSQEKFHQAMFSESARQQRALAAREAVALLEVFNKKGVITVLEAPKPVFPSPAFRCADWFNRNNPICAGGLKIRQDTILQYRQPVMEALETITQQVGNTFIWDPLPVLCPNAVCQALIDGKPLFFDGDHVSGHANMLLFADFTQFILDASNKSLVGQLE